MTLISSNDDLKRYIPNALREAAGERSYFEKIEPFVSQAEDWLKNEIVGPDFYTEQGIGLYAELARRAVACYALYLAIPGLDVVATPNGFGVVSSQTIAPASKERVAAMRESMLARRDECVDALYARLSCNALWRATAHGQSHVRSLFLRPSDFGVNCSLATFVEKRRKAMALEWGLADRAVSHEVFDSIANTVPDQWSGAQCWLVDAIRNIVRSCLEKDCPLEHEYQDIADMVEMIRCHDSAFPQWQTSATRRLWESKSFENDKNAAGYWF